jgi:acyl carrier protein
MRVAMNNGARERIRAFIEENFLFRDNVTLADGDSLLESGVMDSTGILELVAFLETEFPISMTDAEIVPENLDSVAAIVRYVEGKLVPEIAA